MIVKMGYTFNDLYSRSWNGAIDTLNVIIEHDKETELMDFLEQVFEGEAEATELNDFLWFEADYIYENLDINIEEE